MLIIKSMEKKEDNSTENASLSDQNHQMIPSNSFFMSNSIFDMPCEVDQKGSLGLIDMLNVQDFTSPSIFDLLQTPPVIPLQSQLLPSPPSTVPESSEVVNTPASPNSSSMSSSSTEAANDKQSKTVEEEEEIDQEKTKKQ